MHQQGECWPVCACAYCMFQTGAFFILRNIAFKHHLSWLLSFWGTSLNFHLKWGTHCLTLVLVLRECKVCTKYPAQNGTQSRPHGNAAPKVIVIILVGLTEWHSGSSFYRSDTPAHATYTTSPHPRVARVHDWGAGRMRVGGRSMGKERTLIFLRSCLPFSGKLSNVLVGDHHLVSPSSFYFWFSRGITSREHLLFQGFFWPLRLLPWMSYTTVVPPSVCN